MVVGLYVLCGALIAAVYGASLAWNTRLYLSASSKSPAGGALALHVARTTAVAAVLTAFALAGPRPLLAALAGFACAHVALVSLLRRAL